MPQTIPETPKITKKFLIFSLILITCIGFGVYANSLNGDFLWDDESLVQFNPYVKSWSNVGRIFTSRLGSIAQEAGAFYRPVQTFSYLVDYSFWRLNVVGYHMTNIFWHIMTALSLFVLIQCLFHNGKLSLLTAILFVIHPLHTEAVSYVAGRADSLVTCFMYVTFIFYLRHAKKQDLISLIVMSGCFLLAMLSKELCLILVILILFYHYVFKVPLDKKAFGILIATVVAYGLWRFSVVGSAPVARGDIPTFIERLPGVFIAFISYLRLFILPFNLHMEYGGLLFDFNDPQAIVGIIAVILILIFMLYIKKRDTFVFFGIGWYLITLFPSSNVLIVINAYMAEHWLYIPSVGLILIVARFCVRLLDNPKWAGLGWSIIMGIILFLSVLTIQQNRIWNNDISLYKKMLQYAPESSRLHNNLAKAYHDAGQNEELIKLLKSAIKLDPKNALAHNNLGNAYKETGKFKNAVKFYKKAIEIDPKNSGPYYNLSIIYDDILGKTDEAIRMLTKAIDMSPHFSKSYTKLGLIYFKQGKKVKALELLTKSAQLNPDDPEIYNNIGFIYFQSGERKKAKAMYLKAIEADPNHARAYHDIAIVSHGEGNYRQAIEYCDKALALGYVDKQLVDVLKPYR